MCDTGPHSDVPVCSVKNKEALASNWQVFRRPGSQRKKQGLFLPWSLFILKGTAQPPRPPILIHLCLSGSSVDRIPVVPQNPSSHCILLSQRFHFSPFHKLSLNLTSPQQRTVYQEKSENQINQHSSFNNTQIKFLSVGPHSCASSGCFESMVLVLPLWCMPLWALWVTSSWCVNTVLSRLGLTEKSPPVAYHFTWLEPSNSLLRPEFEQNY